MLSWFVTHEDGSPEDVAAGLGVPLALVEELVADLEAAGIIAPTARQ